MQVNDLIERLANLADEVGDLPVVIEVETEVFMNLQDIKTGACGKTIALSIFPDPFEEALKRAGVD